jgi:hypothetical protein
LHLFFFFLSSSSSLIESCEHYVRRKGKMTTSRQRKGGTGSERRGPGNKKMSRSASSGIGASLIGLCCRCLCVCCAVAPAMPVCSVVTGISSSRSSSQLLPLIQPHAHTSHMVPGIRFRQPPPSLQLILLPSLRA